MQDYEPRGLLQHTNTFFSQNQWASLYAGNLDLLEKTSTGIEEQWTMMAHSSSFSLHTFNFLDDELSVVGVGQLSHSLLPSPFSLS